MWTYIYDPAGEQTSVTDPTGAQTQATYNNLGQQVTSTDLVRQNASAAYTTQYSYNDAGELTSQISPTGVTTSETYDALGKQITTTDGAGNTTNYAYDLDGTLTKLTAPDGTATTATYDLAAAGDQAEADSLQSQLYTTVTTYVTINVPALGSSSSGSLSCGTGPGVSLGGSEIATGSCGVSGSSGSPGTSTSVRMAVTHRVKNQAIAEKIQQLEAAAAQAASDSAADTNRGMALTRKALDLLGEWNTTQEEASVAAGRAAAAAAYAAQEKDRAEYLSQVAAADQAAARHAESAQVSQAPSVGSHEFDELVPGRSCSASC